MAEINETGLDLGEDDFDFDAALAKAVGREPEDVSEEEDDDLEEGEHSDAADDVEQEDEEPAGDEEPEDDQVDLDSILERFGVEPGEATDQQRAMAREVHELRSLKGRQGNELGDLRRKVEELGDLVAKRPQQQDQVQPQAQKPPLQITEQLITQLDEMVDQGGDYAQRAAVWALENDTTPDGALFERVMNSWYEVEGETRNATRFEASLQQYLQGREQEEQIAPVLAERQVASQNEAFMASWAKVADEHEDMTALAPAMQEFIGGNERVARRLHAAVQAGDVESIQDEIDALYWRVKSDPSLAATEQVEEETEKKKARKKRGSRPRSSSQRGGGKSTPVSRFKEEMMNEPDTDILSGLTLE